MPDTLRRVIYCETCCEGRLYRQVERYFVVHVPAFDPLAQELGAEEAKAFAGLRWWTLAELEEAEETFAG